MRHAEMADFLREMDPAHRAFLAIFIVIALKAFLVVQWQRFKAAQARKPADMRLRNGVYQEWGIVQRFERIGWLGVWAWTAWMAVVLICAAYLIITGQTLDDVF